MSQGHDLESFVNNVLLKGINRVVTHADSRYLGVGLIAVGIEFLGACGDEKAWHAKDQAEKRFKRGIREFMAKVRDAYLPHNRKNSDFYLYTQLRCTMAHILRLHGTVKVIGRGDANQTGFRHLEVTQLDQPALILVVEDLYDDFERACDLAMNLCRGRTTRKFRDTFLRVSAN